METARVVRPPLEEAGGRMTTLYYDRTIIKPSHEITYKIKYEPNEPVALAKIFRQNTQSVSSFFTTKYEKVQGEKHKLKNKLFNLQAEYKGNTSNQKLLG